MNSPLQHLKLGMLLVLMTSAAIPASAQTNASPRDFAAFQLIADRNIFDPNRRPRVEQARSAPRAPQIVDTFSLVGTMSYSNVLLAFFEGSSPDYRRTTKVGDRIASFTIREIQHSGVKLGLDTSEVQLRIGMQMRRSEDGSWTTAEAAPVSFASNQRGRTERSNSERRGSRSQDQNTVSPADSAVPESAGDLDPNDPVQRMILRRLQEERGTAPQSDESPVEVTTPPVETNALPEGAVPSLEILDASPQPASEDQQNRD